jgi:two-component system response regulator MprA
VIRRAPSEMSVLVVDPDGGRRGALRLALERERVVVGEADDGLQALRAVAEGDYDALLVEVGLPLLDGVELCRRLRASEVEVGVALVSNGTTPEERIAGLEAGADDYLSRPYAEREMVARLRAITRRSRTRGRTPRTLAYADIKLDRASRQAWRGARELQLTRTEFLLLELLVANAEIVQERRRIRLAVWGYDLGGNSLGVYIGYLRRKLEAGGEARVIHTLRHVGYVLRAR